MEDLVTAIKCGCFVTITVCIVLVTILLDKSFDDELNGWRMIEVITIDRKGTGKGAE